MFVSWERRSLKGLGQMNETEKSRREAMKMRARAKREAEWKLLRSERDLFGAIRKVKPAKIGDRLCKVLHDSGVASLDDLPIHWEVVLSNLDSVAGQHAVERAVLMLGYSIEPAGYRLVLTQKGERDEND